MKICVISALLFLALLELQTNFVQSACCKSDFVSKKCDDGTFGTPCCGYRKCNFFCCACECRRGKRDVDSQDEDQEDDDPFLKYDTDGDGKVSLSEAKSWLIAGGCGNPFVKIMGLTSQFGSLDADSDGNLDREEIGG